MPPKVLGTAITYFQRFYLHHSVMDADPKHIMMASVYLACKTEEHYISAEELARMTKQDPSIVLREELNLLNGLNFDLIVHHPYRPLLALQLLLDELAGGERVYAFASDEERRKLLMRKARFAVDSSMVTDAQAINSRSTLR